MYFFFICYHHTQIPYFQNHPNGRKIDIINPRFLLLCKASLRNKNLNGEITEIPKYSVHY